MRLTRLLTGSVGALLFLAACAGTGNTSVLSTLLPSSTAPVASADAVSASGQAAQVLDTLPVKGRAPKTGFDREEQFGPAWADTDRNGCDTRNDILARDLTDVVYRDGSYCVIVTGVLLDPYTGKTIDFTRGQTTSLAVQIDHVVALSDAWQKGAQGLDASTRKDLANDPLNLLAVDGPTNSAKSDSDAASWLPPMKSYRCEYVARQIAVKAKYSLWVTRSEKEAMTRVLSRCPGQTLPRG